jgi:predicted DNA-binding protein (MmcQ/YjbR family)
MNIEEARDHCLTKIAVEECFPFGDENLVFKVGGKIFAIIGIDENKSINLKCDPEFAIELREKYSYITAGYHMNKNHWNTLELSDFTDSKLTKELIDHSYSLIVASLPKKIRDSYKL